GTGTNPEGLAVGDVSGDGKPDLVVANTYSNTVSVLLGNGNGTFQTKVDYGTELNPVAVALGDLGNGKMDLVVANNVANTVSTLFGNGDGTFQSKFDYGVGSSPQSVAIADLTNDGQPDIVTANGNSVSFLRNLGTPVTTAISVMMVTAEASAGRVRLEWYAPG